MSRDEARAWLALSLNLAVLPGLGTLLLRKWVAGAVQLLLSAGGAAGATWWLVWFLRTWARLGHFPIDHGPLFPAGVAGSVAFVASWAWSGRTAWGEIRALKGR